MPLEVIQRSIDLLIGGHLPTDKQVNHELAPYMTDSYAHRLGNAFYDTPWSANTPPASE
jgi:hypothetical protein